MDPFSSQSDMSKIPRHEELISARQAFVAGLERLHISNIRPEMNPCPICLESYRDPDTPVNLLTKDPARLHDGHIFCTRFITGWIVKNSHCPLCRKEFSIENSVEDELLDFFDRVDEVLAPIGDGKTINTTDNESLVVLWGLMGMITSAENSENLADDLCNGFRALIRARWHQYVKYPSEFDFEDYEDYYCHEESREPSDTVYSVDASLLHRKVQNRAYNMAVEGICKKSLVWHPWTQVVHAVIQAELDSLANRQIALSGKGLQRRLCELTFEDQAIQAAYAGFDTRPISESLDSHLKDLINFIVTWHEWAGKIATRR